MLVVQLLSMLEEVERDQCLSMGEGDVTPSLVDPVLLHDPP